MKRNQIMITALAIMLAIAGYLNFAGNKISKEGVATAENTNGEENDVTALLDLSDEDVVSDIDSMDAEALPADNYLDDTLTLSDTIQDVNVDTASAALDNDTEVADGVTDGSIDGVTDKTASAASASAVSEAANLTANDTENLDGSTPGEAVYTSTQAVSSLSAVKLLKEQTRAKNKETLLDIINSTTLNEAQKQEAVDGMIKLTEISEKETAAEILLEAKGFSGAVVSISDESADVVVNAETLSDAQLAQIEDIVVRKTGLDASNIVISTLTGK